MITLCMKVSSSSRSGSDPKGYGGFDSTDGGGGDAGGKPCAARPDTRPSLRQPANRIWLVLSVKVIPRTTGCARKAAQVCVILSGCARERLAHTREMLGRQAHTFVRKASMLGRLQYALLISNFSWVDSAPRMQANASPCHSCIFRIDDGEAAEMEQRLPHA
eukprot:3623251-Pleurochrysis_carterae.AAC.1